jgi:hypothetical protein
MTTPVKVTTTFTNTDGLTKDATQLDWAFLAEDLTSTTLDGISASIASFFNTSAGMTHAIAARMSSMLSTASNAVENAFYDLTGHLSGGALGSPVHVKTWTLAAVQTSSRNMPAEVALRQSLLADGWEDVPETAVNPSPPPALIRPRARYRGGFYLGPFNDSAYPTTGDVEPRPKTEFTDDLAIAWDRFMDERGGDFAVWSRADGDLKLIAPGGLILCDNAFDTIRKRGPDSTARFTVWP